MNTEKTNKQLMIFYVIGIIFLIPVISYYFSIPDILPKQGYIQVFLSGPVLIILGGVLFFLYKKKRVGLVFSAIGLWWILNIIYEVVTK